jgi:hypothetical protein
MRARELIRRILIWGVVTAFLAFVIMLAVLGQWVPLLGFSAFPVVGAIILTSRPGNGVGWYLLGVGIVCLAIMWGLDPEITEIVAPWAESAMNAIAGGFWLSLMLIGVIYPSGRIETRLGRIAAIGLVVVVAIEIPLFLVDPAPMFNTGRQNPFAFELPPVVWSIQTALLPVSAVVLAVLIVIDLVRRWRRAGAVERLQYRWFGFSLVGVFAIVAIAALVVPSVRGSALDTAILLLASLGLNAIPISIGIAVTRHGLYEIGRVVSRTVSYAGVTLVAIGVYALVVTSVSLLLPDQSTVPVAIATLVAAAVFLPALRWFQRVVDRRFDREHYDAEHVVDEFGERLRTGADPSATAPDLLHAVEQTLQPTSVGMWTTGGTR